MKICETIASGEMRRISKISRRLALPVLAALTLVCCTRRPLENEDVPAVARIPVHIDWSRSGLNPSNLSNTASLPEADQVHRVSIRFYPTDGSAPFDRYLEQNVVDGVIDVPIGSYKVIVFNETIDDTPWWSGAITFTDADNYDKFTAHAVPNDPAQWTKDFPFVHPGPNERVIIGPDPRKLASWSLSDFEVTPNMVLVTNGRAPVARNSPTRTSAYTAYETSMSNALMSIVMRRLTYNVTVTAHMKNLVSSQTNYCYVSGFATEVNMASALTSHTPATKLFLLNGRRYDANMKDGTTTHGFLSFGRTPAPELYTVAMDVLYVSGVLYRPDPAMGLPELKWDVSDQVDMNNIDLDFNIDINIDIALEYVAGGIAVDDWNDTYHTILQ